MSQGTTSRAAPSSMQLRGCLRRNWPDHLSRGIFQPRVARMSRAKLAGPPQVRASRSIDLRGCLRRRAQSCKDVSGATSRITPGQGISEPRGARMSQAKLPRPPRAQLLRARRFEDVSSEIGRITSRAASLTKMAQAKLVGPPVARHVGAQSCNDVSGEIGGTTSGQGISEPRVARRSQVRRAGPPQVLWASLRPELQGCLTRNGPSHLRSGRL